ncbi:MAG TPA: lytic transglycosylase domain-containing protein [Longimicrobiales bacterium]|nr:lytic transglycosylase domain-containing protein [Longimicrobiales bacterium]
MALFGSRRAPRTHQRSGILEDLDKLVLRARALPVAALALMLVGFGASDLTRKWLFLPEGTSARSASDISVPNGHLDEYASAMQRVQTKGESTVEYVMMYTEHVQPVETVLRRRGVPEANARRIAWPLVEHSYQRNLDPAFVVSVVLMESGGKPTATSVVGARGLMQVMPFWGGKWRNCGRDLYQIDDNLCNGTSILAWYLGRHPNDERKALLGYNGCVRGTVTPSCFLYPDKVMRLRQQIGREINAARPRPLGAAAAL